MENNKNANSQSCHTTKISNTKSCHTSGGKALYDDNNIPEIDTKDVIPDEVPRRDGPGGE